jgi:hypothetical protein
MDRPQRDKLGEPQNPTVDLQHVLETARRALKRGDGWDCDGSHYSRLVADCEKLGVYGEPAITVRLRKSFEEITVKDLRARIDKSYSGLQAGQTLYEANWTSVVSDHRAMYIKFCLADEGKIEICTFHESTV